MNNSCYSELRQGKRKITNLAVSVFVGMIYTVKMVGSLGLEPTTSRL